MSRFPDLARAEQVIADRGGELGRPFHFLTEVSSTNDEARRAAKLGAPHGSTWVAESQTAGRGRQGRTWVSPPGENLLFSVLIRTSSPAVRLPLVPLVAGLAVADAVERAAPSAEVLLKWPNDVVVPTGSKRHKKIAGILVETSMIGDAVDAIVVGVGINVHTRTFPADLEALATSIASESPSPVDRAEILADVLGGLDRDVGVVLAMGLGPVHARLSRRDALRGRRVRSERGVGMAVGIDLEGRLVVEGGNGARVTWSAGEVHLA